MMRELVKGGANIQERHGGIGLMAVAVSEGQAEMIRELTKMGLDINDENEDGSTPIFYSTPTSLKALIELGVDVNKGRVEGQTALHFAVKENSMEMVRVMEKPGAWLKEKDGNGDTPQMLAAKLGFVEVSEFLAVIFFSFFLFLSFAFFLTFSLCLLIFSLSSFHSSFSSL